MTWDQALVANGFSAMTALARESADISNPVDAKKLEYLTTS